MFTIMYYIIKYMETWYSLIMDVGPKIEANEMSQKSD